MSELVVLLDEDGAPAGTADKAHVHTTCTPLHLAFSCHVIDPDGRVLVTRRALTKRTWPGVWTNSFCGHPGPGEGLEDAVRRRAAFELGLELAGISDVLPDFRYQATDASGIVENEVCPVVVAAPASGSRVQPNPDEVMDHLWVPVPQLLAAIEAAPWALSPWLVQSGPGLAAAWGAP
ncbi:isopentenyl-diphosphate Delta-isomerase [Isoptericola sp. b441]|uniref:Isopentenyl-diphosphate Delta-isomerase n=1 Tax=Actinotalea lenta TaxID=3064654 RepID=A0ABT9D848_9CELL|nr:MULTISPECIES: isopentenyl-diphosphate Delta-isomerase [unclassified Isoptericola]MDO8106298.1 isopentenyl-diphosphate Delta-isomerase [Isoptericola sp. b441]MDO8121982.1 isopentenyl-diphosphate Delta-isomerase [Isoptericola sp. b490]